MKKEEIIPYFLGRGEVKPTIRTNLGMLCGVGCYIWVVYVIGLMFGDVVSLPLNWYSAYAEASIKEANRITIETSIAEMEQSQQQFHLLLKQQCGLKKCIKLYKQLQAIGGSPVSCKIDSIERVKTSTGTVVPEVKSSTLIEQKKDTPEKVYPTTYKGAGDGVSRPVPFKGWRVSRAGYSKTFIELKGSKKEDRMWHLLSLYDLGESYGIWIDVGKKFGIKPELLVCIAWADSDLGRALKTPYNLGNVGNTDSGKVRSFPTLEAGISAIGETLNNGYLGHKQAVGSLTPTGGGNPAYYASEGFPYREPSGNWNANVINCLNMVYGKLVVDEDWFFRS